MAKGNIIGRVNIPISPITYTGETTETAETIVNNEDKTIEVNVLGLENYATKTELSEKANDNEVVKLTGNQTIHGNKSFSGNIDINGVIWEDQRISFPGEEGDDRHYLWYYTQDSNGPAFGTLGIGHASIDSLNVYENAKIRNLKVEDEETGNYIPVATENFAKDYTDNAIAQITPSKLYKHNIKVTDNNSDLNLEISAFTSLENTPATTLQSLKNVLLRALTLNCSFFESDEGISGICYFDPYYVEHFTNNLLLCGINLTDFVSKEYTLTDSLTITDTVTEL